MLRLDRGSPPLSRSRQPLGTRIQGDTVVEVVRLPPVRLRELPGATAEMLWDLVRLYFARRH
jgi:hypothetical protein